MAYCPKCGVEVEAKRKTCPLCSTPIPDVGQNEQEESLLEAPKEEAPLLKPKLSGSKKRRLTLEILSIFLLSPIMLVMVIDLVINKRLTWSVYPMLSLLFTYVTSALFLLFYRKWIIIGLGIYLLGNGFLYLLERTLDMGKWYLSIGLPALTLFSLVLFGIIQTTIWTKRKGFNIAAYVILGMATYTLGIDFLLGFKGILIDYPTWGLFVFLSTLPVAGFFIFVHYRLEKAIDLKKYFHT